MPIAISVKIKCDDPEKIFRNRWAHEIVREIIKAKLRAEMNLGVENILTKNKNQN